MKNWSLKAKIIMVLAAVVTVGGIGYTFLQMEKTADFVRQGARLEAQKHIDRTISMLMVSTRKFHDDFLKARAMGPIEAQVVLDDCSRMKSALVDAVTEDFGNEVVRIRLVGDADIFGIEPLGKKENIGIKTPFEREAVQAIIKGKERVETEQEGYLSVAVPLPSQLHPGCAACHLSLRKGLDSDLKQNITLGTLNVYMPLQATLAKERGKTLQIIFVTMIMLVLVCIALYYFMHWSVTNPIGQAVALTKRIAQGDLDVDFTVQQNDEIGMLAGSMNKMVGNMRELTLAAEKIAEGDLTVRLTVLSEKDALGHALKRMVEKLSAIIGEINLSAQNVLAGAEHGCRIGPSAIH